MAGIGLVDETVGRRGSTDMIPEKSLIVERFDTGENEGSGTGVAERQGSSDGGATVWPVR